MKPVTSYMQTMFYKTAVLVLSVLAFLATAWVLDMVVVLDGRTVGGDAIIIASSILITGALLVTPRGE